MPAWSTGTDEGKQGTWHLVHFIRELPRLTPERIENMKALNPRPLSEVRQELEGEQFRKGGSKGSPPPKTRPHKHF
jgi:hypothetical protein